ncbi:gastric intrinsic factor-like [Pelobates cultripes]|uniref:Gastric intrinsic factor-like n=1 Tax=Pelobates cultripes TaxID=61616 RepID=A0AAD1T9V3_PELCU|nr:gastric intrinsic factor-like [Pelobates cultripes]
MLWIKCCVVLLVFTYASHADPVCSVPDSGKASVTALVLNMAKSVGPCVTPNPSVLLALNLVDKTFDPATADLLVKQLKEDAVTKVSENLPFSSGKVALYALALRSSCCDITNIPYSKGNLNLVSLLENKTKEEIKSIEKEKKKPLTTFYQVALDVLALCVVNSHVAFQAGTTLANAVPSNPTSPDFSVDTAAVAVMGFTCVLGMDAAPTKTISSVKNALSVLINLMLNNQMSDGIIGNIYSTGLAAQALTAAQSYYTTTSWNCPLTIQKVLQEIPLGTFSLPIAAAQVLPFLQGMSYVNVKDKQCTVDNSPRITVEYTIVNNLVEENFKYTIQVEVLEGSTLLQVMQKAAQINPKEFSFSTTDSEWGVFVSSINNLAGNNNQRTYWQFFNETTPLQLGVSSYKPTNKEHILAIFSKF